MLSGTGNTCPEPLGETAPSEEGPSSQKTGARSPGGQKVALFPPGELRAGAGIAGYYEQAGLSSLFVYIPSDEMADKPLQCLSCVVSTLATGSNMLRSDVSSSREYHLPPVRNSSVPLAPRI